MTVITFIFKCVILEVCLSVCVGGSGSAHVSEVPSKSRRGHWIPWRWSQRVASPPVQVLGTEPGSPAEQSVFLITELYFQPSHVCVYHGLFVGVSYGFFSYTVFFLFSLTKCFLLPSPLPPFSINTLYFLFLLEAETLCHVAFQRQCHELIAHSSPNRSITGWSGPSP